MIIPGIFEKEKTQLLSKLNTFDSFVELIQVDIADGILVDGVSFNQRDFFESTITSSKLQLHLMLEKPLFYLEIPLPSVTSICAQIEAPFSPEEFLTMAKNLGYETGFSINPKTPFSKVGPYIERLDFIQFMTVVPGAQGREFEFDVLKKMSLFKERYPNIKIQVDGGINENTLPLVLESGADDVIIGSALYKDENPIQMLKEFEELIK